jgi:tetratricopeptide (TPR) repeat protein/tRNA A-37 threonylcarbamoyl transferase component Bud32
MTDTFDRLKAALAHRYEIERELGTGGMATVYLAHDVRHDRKVAVKVLRPELAATLGSDRFLREIRIAAKLTHPHILPLHDSGDAGGSLYYVMPFIEGESLRNRLSRGGELPIPEAVRLLRDVVDALALAHKHGVVHRDIKPDNVMLAEDHAMVTDFGVAKAVTEAATESELTTFGMAVGTPTYMSPEQAAGDPNIDHRADLYAVGAMAYEMLTGRPPFEGETPQTVLAAHVAKQPRPVADLRDAIPSPLAAVVMRCLEKRPADRWQSAAELRAQLDALTTPSGALTPAGAWTAVGASARIGRAHPARVLGLYAIGAAAMAFTAYGLMVALGLPSWVLPTTLMLLTLGLPAVFLTGRAERRRAARPSDENAVPDSEGLHRWFTWWRLSVSGGMAFGALAIATGAYMGMRTLGIGPVGTLVAAGVLAERERIVLAQFSNRTQDSTIGETVTELFRIDLAQSPSVTVLEPAQVARVLVRMQRDPDTLLSEALAAEVAEREGLKAIVTGEVLPVGTGYVVSSRLTSIGTGQVLWAGRETAADATAIVGAVDRLSASLRAKIGESLRTIRGDAPLDRVTTRSTAALRKYAQADRANNQADYDRAVRLLEEALAEDSTFAMAYRKLAVILRNQDRDHDRSREAFTKAFALRERLTERERYLAEAAYYTYVEEEPQTAIAVYRTLLDKYPTDRIALNNLAVVYTQLGRRKEASDLYVRSIALGGAPAVTFTNAISALYDLGLRDSAAAILARFEAEYPDQPQVLQYQAAFLSSEFNYPAAEALVQELRAAQRGNPVFDMMTLSELAAFAAAQGRVEEGLRLINEAFDVQERHGIKMIEQPRALFESEVTAVLNLRYYGDVQAAIDALDDVQRTAEWQALPPEEREYLDFAQLYAEAGNPQRGRTYIRRYESEVDAQIRARDEQQTALLWARGALDLAEGRALDAVAAYHGVRERLPGCTLCALFELGAAFAAADEPDSAIAAYEQYLEGPVLFRSGQDNVTLWLVLRRLATLHEQQGNTQQAIDYYNRFLELWQNAEPRLQPHVSEARDRLAQLVGEPR